MDKIKFFTGKMFSLKRFWDYFLIKIFKATSFIENIVFSLLEVYFSILYAYTHKYIRKQTHIHTHTYIYGVGGVK